HAAPSAHHHRVVNLTLLHLAARDRVLDAHLDDVAHGRITTACAAEHLDAHQGTRAAVVGGVEHRLELDHVGVPLTTGGLLDHLDQAPRLASRHRPARRDGHEVADVGLAVL